MEGERPLGNAEVIQFLTEWLKLAEDGKMTWVCVVGVQPLDGQGEVGCGFAGERNMTHVGLTGIRALFQQILIKYQSHLNDNDIRIKV